MKVGMFGKKRKSAEKRAKKRVEKGSPKNDPKKGPRGPRKSIISGPGRLFHHRTDPPRPSQRDQNRKKSENQEMQKMIEKKHRKKIA